MKQLIAAIAGLVALSACGEPAPTPEPAPAATAKHGDQWFAFEQPSLAALYAALNLHETDHGLSGRVILLDGSGVPVRARPVPARQDISLHIPALGVSFTATRQPNGDLAGSWTDATGAALPVTLKTGTTPPLEAGRFIQLGDGRRMHMICSGQGEPAVLLDYGAGGTMKKDWADLSVRIAEASRTTVCAYDRAGRGLSDPATTARDAFAVSDDIFHMVNNAGFASPLVLVGHSLGSYHVRAFANGHAVRTAGLVLVDPSGDGQMERLRPVVPKLIELEMSTFVKQQELNCVARLREKLVPPEDPVAKECGGNDPESIWAFRSEIEQMPGASTQQLVDSRRSYADMPVIVLTRGDYEKGMPPMLSSAELLGMKSVWETMHAEMAALSSRGEHRFVEEAGHYIQLDRPEAIITAVSDVVAAVRAGPK